MTKSVPSIKPAPEPEYKLHPTGDFEAKFLEWGDIKQSATGRPLWHMTAKMKTEHGVLWSTYSGMPDALMLLTRSAPYYRSYGVFKVRVKHRTYKDQTFAHCEVLWNETEI